MGTPLFDISLAEVVEVNSFNEKQKFIEEPFLLGPFSLEWISKAAHLPGKSLHLALVAGHIGRLRSETVVKLQPSKLRSFGLDRYSGYRALNSLIQSGLVEVLKRKRGEAPTIKLVGVIPQGANWDGRSC